MILVLEYNNLCHAIIAIRANIWFIEAIVWRSVDPKDREMINLCYAEAAKIVNEHNAHLPQ